MPRTRILTTVLILIFTVLTLCPGICDEAPRYAGLTILHTNDIHGQLFPFDYGGLGPVEKNVGGAARRAALIRKLESESKNPVLVMDAGDVFTRGPLQELHGAPDFEVLNAVPYDVMTLGNNEFKGASGNEGMKILFERMKQARFPILCANIIDSSTGKTIAKPYIIFERNGVKIGIFGVSAPRIASYEQAKGLEVRDPIAVAKEIVPELEKNADFIIGLTHIGYALDMQLAQTVKGIDVIIGGDSHTWLPTPTLVKNPIEGRPEWWTGGTVICQDGEWGKCVGRLDLALRRTGSGRFIVMSYSGSLVPVDAKIEPAPDVTKILDRHAKPFTKVVGKLEQAVPASTAAEWVAERMREVAGAEAGYMPKNEIAAGLPAGNVTELDLRKMLLYSNRIFKLTVTAGQLKTAVSQLDVALAGVQLRDEAIFLGDKKLSETDSCTLAVDEFYARNSPAFAGATMSDLGITTKDAISRFVSGGTPKNK